MPVVCFSSLQIEGHVGESILGRVFQFVSDDAYDTVTTKNNAGLLQPVDQWLLDDELIKSKAIWHYQTANCDLL